MQGEKNMYGVSTSVDEQMRGRPTFTAHQVWKQAGTPAIKAICEAAGVSYKRFAMVRIGQINLSYASARLLQYGVYLSLGVVVDLDTLCNAVNYREHQEAIAREAFEAAKVPA
jgi:hypothetical protein